MVVIPECFSVQVFYVVMSKGALPDIYGRSALYLDVQRARRTEGTEEERTNGRDKIKREETKGEYEGPSEVC